MITTARYAGAASRELARSIADALGRAYVPRGKKTLDSLARSGRFSGKHVIMIIKESGGVPSEAEFVSIDEFGKWAWLADKVHFSGTNGGASAEQLKKIGAILSHDEA
ncbi:MAG: hypothetical protein ACP5NX_04700 [Candidatus Bilamarchaeaceae archaeon]